MDANARLGASARAHPGWLWASSALGACAGMLVLPQAFLLARVIDGVFLKAADVAAPLAGIVALLAVRGVLSAASGWCAQRLAEAVKADLHARLHAQVLTLGPAFIRGERTGELVASATEGLEQLDAYLRGYLPQRAIAMLVPLAVLAAALPLDWITGVTLLVTAPLVPLFMVLVGTLAATQGARQFAALRAIGAQLLDALQGLTTLKLFGRSHAQADTLAELGERFRKASMNALQYAFLSSLVMELIATIGTALVAVGLGLRLLNGRIGFEESLFLLLLAPELYAPLRTLGMQFHAATNARAAASRIFAVLDRKPLARSGPRRISDPSAPRLVFEDVHVEHPDGRRGLKGAAFEIAAGERVALVGPTGAGKSTTVDLLLRFIDPTEGIVRWNGVALTELSADDVRAHIAWVPQRPYLLPASVADNLGLGRAGATEDELWAVLGEVGLASTVRALPDGLATTIGERGATFSGGQAQRLAIARALLKDAPLVIFDEPSAQLDVATERGIEDAMERLTRGRTALVVTHRVALAQRVDRIVVLEGGRVVESGAPDALLKSGGAYRALADFGLVPGVVG